MCVWIVCGLCVDCVWIVCVCVCLTPLALHFARRFAMRHRDAIADEVRIVSVALALHLPQVALSHLDVIEVVSVALALHLAGLHFDTKVTEVVVLSVALALHLACRHLNHYGVCVCVSAALALHLQRCVKPVWPLASAWRGLARRAWSSLVICGAT